MSKLSIETIDGVETGKMIVKFDLGEIKNEKTENGVILGVGTENMSEYMKRLAFQHAQGDNLELFEDAIEEWFTLKMNRLIGVTSYPILRGEDGSLIGLDENVER